MISEKQFKHFISRGQKAQRAVDIISEKQWQQDVKDLARLLGWKTYHTLRSKGSDPDFPDLVMARRRNIGSVCPEYETRIIVAELKKEGEYPTVGQQDWLDFFTGIGVETHVWRPRDLEEVKKALR